MTTCKDCASALMRAEAAEALLAELRSECEALRAELDELREPEQEEEQDIKIKPITSGFDLGNDSFYFDMETLKLLMEGSQWTEDEMRRMKSGRELSSLYGRVPLKTPKIRRKGGTREKDWDKKTPSMTASTKPRNPDGIEVTVEEYFGGGRPSWRVTTCLVARPGDNACYILTERDLERGKGWIRDIVREVLSMHAPSPPTRIVEEVTEIVCRRLIELGAPI